MMFMKQLSNKKFPVSKPCNCKILYTWVSQLIHVTYAMPLRNISRIKIFAEDLQRHSTIVIFQSSHNPICYVYNINSPGHTTKPY